MVIKLSKRISTSELPKAKGTVTLAGWAQDIRALSKINFILLRDRSGTAQLVLKKLPKNLTRESVIAVTGKVKASKSRQFTHELEVSKLEVLSTAATPLPIEFLKEDIDTGLDKRLDWRTIDLRNPKRLAIFKIRAETERAIHDFFRSKKFIHVTTSKICGAGAEGGADLFTFPYFNRSAALNQSQQIYKQFMQSAGFERSYEIGPSFRAEKSHTLRHISEFTHLDVEMSFIETETDIQDIAEQLLASVIKHIKSACKDELKLLDKTIETPKLPLPKVKYVDAIKMLKKHKFKIKAGDDIGTEGEKILGHLIKKKYGADAYFLTKFPTSLDVVKFYSKVDGKIGRVADLEYRGQELATTAQREHDYDKLIKQIKVKKLKPADFEFYTRAFKYGMPPHGGFGMGVERLVMFMLNISNIREVTLFPRDPERLTP
jgi:aspartyl-tRNA synthetase